MPDHSTWPSGLRYAERAARATGYAATAAAGLFVVSGPALTPLAVLAGGLGVVSTLTRWWHAELVATAALVWVFAGYAVLVAADGRPGTVALCVVGAAASVRRVAELLMFSAQVRRARQERVQLWQQVLDTVDDEERT